MESKVKNLRTRSKQSSIVVAIVSFQFLELHVEPNAVFIHALFSQKADPASAHSQITNFELLVHIQWVLAAKL